MKKVCFGVVVFMLIFATRVFAHHCQGVAQTFAQTGFGAAATQETIGNSGERERQNGNVISVYTKPTDSLINLYLKITSGDYRRENDLQKDNPDFVMIDSAAFFRHNPANRLAAIRKFSRGGGSVEIRSNIERGLLIVNDSLEYPGTRFPVILTNIPVGNHTVRVRSDLGIIGMSQVNIIDERRTAAEVTVVEPKAGVKVRSTPTASFVYLDGRRVGHTPIEVDGLDAGTYQLRVERPGYMAFNTRIEVERGKMAQIDVSLIHYVPDRGEVPVYAQPKYIAGASLGTAGLVFGILAIVNRVSSAGHFSDGEDYEEQFNQALELQRPQASLDELHQNELRSKLRAENARDRSNIFFMLSFISASFSVPILVF